jgi:hypothetical protein
LRILGSHSLRKGATTDIGANPGTTDDRAINRRAGWSNGAINDTYHQYNSGQDRVLGRLTAGYLPEDLETFSTLPPHFMPGEEVISGDRSQLLPPLRLIDSAADFETEPQRNIFTKTKTVMNGVQYEATAEPDRVLKSVFTIKQLEQLEFDANFRKELYQKGYGRLFNMLYPGSAIKEHSTTTLYKDLKAFEKRNKQTQRGSSRT